MRTCTGGRIDRDSALGNAEPDEEIHDLPAAELDHLVATLVD